MSLVWRGWLEFAHRAAAYQSRLLLNALYFVVFGPSALLARLLRVRLVDLDVRPRRSYWLERQPTIKSVPELKRQF